MTLPLEPPVPKNWPTFITAGATFKLDRIYEKFSQPDFALALYFVGPTVSSFNASPQIIKDPDGRTYHIVLGAADTAALNPAGGTSLAFSAIERITSGSSGDVFDVATTRVMVSPNVATAAAGDFYSPEEKLLNQLQTTLAARLAGNAVESYSVSGRSITKVSTKELRDMIGSLKWMVYRQRNPGRIGVPGEFSFPVDRGTAPFPWPYRFDR
jgi:hypothetical protein